MEEYLRYGDLICLSLENHLFATTLGFISTSLHMEESTNRDFYLSIFRVFPQTLHSIQTEIAAVASDSPEKLQESILRLKESAEGEIKTNLQIYTNFEKQPIKYGSLIQLQHVSSGKFLSVEPTENAEHEKDNFKVTVRNFVSDCSKLRINPAFKYQKEGNALVRYVDSVFLEFSIPGITRSGFLHVIEDLDEVVKEVNCSLDNKTYWKMQLYSTFRDNENLITGDYIWLYHTEHASSIIQKGNSLLFSNSAHDSNGIWKLEGAENHLGETIKTDSHYRIQHLCTGFYLSLQTDSTKSPPKLRAILTSTPDSFSLWRFSHVYKRKKVVEKSQLYSLINAETGAMLDCRMGKDSPIIRKTESETAFFKIIKCEESDLNHTQLLLSCEPPISQFIKLLTKLDTENLNLRHFFHVCNHFNLCLGQLDLYLNNRLIGFIDFQKQFGQIQLSRQQSLNELRFIEQLTEVLSLFDPEHLYAKLSHRPDLVVVYKKLLASITSVYKTLGLIVQKNPTNQALAFGFADIYKDHANWITGCTSFLLNLVESNQSLLFSLSKPPSTLIQHYTWLLRINTVRKPHLVSFLQSICSYQGASVQTTQECIHEYLFSNEETFKRAVIPTVAQLDTISIILPCESGEQELLLNTCFAEGEVREEFQVEISYFIKMLDLFACLCKGRNYTCKASIKDWFPVDVLLNNIWDTTLSSEMRASFVRLMVNLYVDSHPRHEDRFPESVKVLSLQENEDQILKAKNLFSLQYMEVTTIGLVKSGATFSNYKKSTEYRNEGLIQFEGEELILFRLKEDLIGHLEEVSRNPVYDGLIFELISLAGQLVKFKIITNAKTEAYSNSAIISPYNSLFDYEQLDLTRLLRPLIEMLVCNEFLVHVKTAKSDLKAKKDLPEFSELIFERADPTPMKQVLRGYSNYIKMQAQGQTLDLSYKTLCKIEICKLLNYMLSWRLDFLVNNVIAWFNIKGTDVEMDYAELFPPIGSNSSKFTLHKEPEIKDLSFYSRTVYQDLIVQFVKTKDYELRTLLLMVLSKAFNMRVKLMQQINKIQIVTTVETSEMYIWMKNYIRVIQQMAEQSELWLNYWRQTKEVQDDNLTKIKILQTAVEKVNDSLDSNSRLKESNLVAGRSRVVDKTRQRTYINLYLHEYIVVLLQDSMQSVSELFVPNATQEQQEARTRFSAVLEACYKLLLTLTKKNRKIQEIFYGYLNVFMQYVHIPVGQIELICEIFKGNEKLCGLVTERFLMSFADLIFKYGRQVRFLKIFEVVQGNEEHWNHENQRLVAKVLLDHDYHFLCYMSRGKQNAFEFEASTNAANEQYKDQPFEYQAKLLEVLMLCSFGSHGVYLTEVKCQKLIGIDYIFELLSKKNEPGYSALYSPLLQFFYHAYIDTEKVNESLMNCVPYIAFLRTQGNEIRSKQNFSLKESSDLALMIETLTKYISSYFIGDFFDITFESIKHFLEAIHSKFDLISETCFKQTTLEKLEALGKQYDIDFPPLIIAEDRDEQSARQSVNCVKTSWHEFKQDFLFNTRLKKLIKEEKNQVVKIFLEISEHNGTVSTSDLMVSILEYINNYTFHKPKTSLLNKSLKMLTFFLTHIPKASKDQLVQIKQQLNEAGIVRIIMALLCDSTTGSTTFTYLLMLANELLDNGNSEFQSSFFHYFTINQTSQVFFSRIHHFFSNYMSSSKSKWAKQPLIYKEKLSECQVILRFLQLLCENHNSSLQNYLRDQYKFRHTTNLVLSTIMLLEDMLKKCRDFDFLVISQCFDTLTEFIQGPCAGNQIAIVDSKFLEVASRLLSFDEQSDNLSKYQLLKEEMLSSAGSRDSYSTQCLTGWMIAHLKYKCLITLLSLLEGQSGNYVITRMIRSLNIEILKENIISFYHSFTLLYSSEFYDTEIFGHFEKNEDYHPKKDTDHVDRPEYYETIIEVGFMVYHLMCHFKDNEDPENKRIIKNELPELAINEAEQGFIGTKLFKELGNFGFALFKSGFNQLKKIVKTKNRNLEEVDKLKILKSAYEFFQKHTGNIEIVYKQEIFRIYFWIRPEGHFITEENKENFHFYVERSSPKAKVQYLLKHADEIIEEMVHESKLAKLLNRNFLVKLIASYVNVWKDVAFLMTLGLNLVIIMSFYGNVGNNEAIVYDVQYQQTTLSIVNIMGSIQMGCSCCIVAFFLLKTAPVLIARGWRSHDWKNQSRFLIIKLFQKTKNGLLTLYFALSNVDVLYQIGYLICSVLGTAVNPFFFSLHLLDVLYRYPTLQTVIKSVTVQKEQVGLAFLLIFVLIYLYTIWTYLSFSSYFFIVNDPCVNNQYDCIPNITLPITNGSYCDTMGNCLLTIFDQGLKCGGGIGDFINQHNPEFDDQQRLVFDTLFYITFIAIMLNVIQGIIVDTFAYLRDINTMNSEDQENRCFICSLDKEFIEFTTERPFKFHTTFEHSEWNYVIFIDYLKNKKESERTGMESYLIELIEQDDSSWIPQYKALSIKKKVNEEEDGLGQKLEEVERIYEELEKEMKDVRRAMMQYLENKHMIKSED